MEVRSKNTLGISLLNPPLSDIYAMRRKEGKKMEIATVIGVPPAVFIASILKVPTGVDKLSVAGGLKGEPVETISAETVDLDIPPMERSSSKAILIPGARRKMESSVIRVGTTYPLEKARRSTSPASDSKKGSVPCRRPLVREVDSILYLVHVLILSLK